jgi:hypothetical protein
VNFNPSISNRQFISKAYGIYTVFLDLKAFVNKKIQNLFDIFNPNDPSAFQLCAKLIRCQNLIWIYLVLSIKSNRLHNGDMCYQSSMTISKTQIHFDHLNK